MWRQDHGGYDRAGHWNMPQALGHEASDSEFIRFLQAKEWVIDLKEYQATPERYENLRLPEWLTAVPRATRPLMPWKMAARRNMQKAM